MLQSATDTKAEHTSRHLAQNLMPWHPTQAEQSNQSRVGRRHKAAMMSWQAQLAEVDGTAPADWTVKQAPSRRPPSLQRWDDRSPVLDETYPRPPGPATCTAVTDTCKHCGR
jgi:hypothetical protein